MKEEKQTNYREMVKTLLIAGLGNPAYYRYTRYTMYSSLCGDKNIR